MSTPFNQIKNEFKVFFSILSRRILWIIGLCIVVAFLFAFKQSKKKPLYFSEVYFYISSKPVSRNLYVDPLYVNFGARYDKSTQYRIFNIYNTVASKRLKYRLLLDSSLGEPYIYQYNRAFEIFEDGDSLDFSVPYEFLGEKEHEALYKAAYSINEGKDLWYSMIFELRASCIRLRVYSENEEETINVANRLFRLLNEEELRTQKNISNTKIRKIQLVNRLQEQLYSQLLNRKFRILDYNKLTYNLNTELEDNKVSALFIHTKNSLKTNHLRYDKLIYENEGINDYLTLIDKASFPATKLEIDTPTKTFLKSFIYAFIYSLIITICGVYISKFIND